jgi:hypothetical protein
MAKRKRTPPSCPVCKKSPTAYTALAPHVDGVTVMDPHRYNVCQRCYLTQYAAKYGEGEHPEAPAPRLRNDPWDTKVGTEFGVPAYVEPDDD